MRRRLSLCLVVGSLASPSCVVYDSALLDEAQGASTLNEGSGGGTGGLTDSNGGTGGVATTGGQDALGGDGGGSDGGSGGRASGGSGGQDPGTGGDVGAGGGTGCEEPSGEKGALTEVDDTNLIEDFERDWAKLGTGAPFTGNWFVSRDSSGSGLSTTIYDLYEQDPCSTDKSLHVLADGYDTWGISLDAGLLAGNSEFDADMYDGVTFWARSDDLDQLRVGFSDGDDSNGTTSIDTNPQFLGATWQQLKFEFPAAVVKDRLTIVHLIAGADTSHDLWIDELSFYSEP